MTGKLWERNQEGKLKWIGGSYWNLLLPRDWRDVLVIIVIIGVYLMVTHISAECWDVYEDPCNYCATNNLYEVPNSNEIQWFETTTPTHLPNNNK